MVKLHLKSTRPILLQFHTHRKKRNTRGNILYIAMSCINIHIVSLLTHLLYSRNFTILKSDVWKTLLEYLIHLIHLIVKTRLNPTLRGTSLPHLHTPKAPYSTPTHGIGRGRQKPLPSHAARGCKLYRLDDYIHQQSNQKGKTFWGVYMGGDGRRGRMITIQRRRGEAVSQAPNRNMKAVLSQLKSGSSRMGWGRDLIS